MQHRQTAVLHSLVPFSFTLNNNQGVEQCEAVFVSHLYSSGHLRG
jgi:hypothetical protein